MRATSAATFSIACILFAACATAGEPAAAQPTHPMDALTAAEISDVTAILKAAGKVDDKTAFAAVSLHEGSKDAIRAWRPGQPLKRQAFVALMQGTQLHEAIVDIARRRVESWVHVPGKHARIMEVDYRTFGLIKDDPRFQQALRKRGYSPPFDTVICISLTAGPAAAKQWPGKRVAHAPCFDNRDADGNFFGKPIEGLMIVVDTGDPAILEVVDLGVTPVPEKPGSLRYDQSSKYRSASKPVQITTPAGSNIAIDGSQVRWDNWRFHLRIDQRVGPILSLVQYDDRGALRSVLYQLSPSEMFVPYMDPATTWSWRAYMDIGEYGFGKYASSLRPETDCPASARFIDAVLPDDRGAPIVKKDVACLFERPTGDPVWRHDGVKESRPNVELVVRMAPVVGNYDYFIDYVFTRAGDIDVRVGAMGINAVKGVVAKTLADASAKLDSAYGTLIAPGLSGINHDHFISFRVDADVDGEQNRVVLDEVHTESLPPDNSRRSLWRVTSRPVQTAGPFEHSHSGLLRLESASRRNATGNPTSYQLFPGHTETSLLSADDPIQIRAAWARHPIWLSVFDSSQKHASGDYPNLDTEADGLQKWTKDRQPLADRDVVLWYNVGFRHITRAEDWPAMPAVWHSFRLRPFNFFDRSPAMDIVPDPAQSVSGAAAAGQGPVSATRRE